MNGGNFLFMPMPMPFGGGGGVPPQQPSSDGIVPARVEKALEFLSYLHNYTKPRVAVSDFAIQQIDGAELSPDEIHARDSALQALRLYFEGKLTPDIWETLRYDWHRAKVDAANTSLKIARQAAEASRSAGINVMPCPQCQSPGNVSCPLCRGLSRVAVTPLVPPPEDPEEEEPEEPGQPPLFRHPEVPEGYEPRSE